MKQTENKIHNTLNPLPPPLDEFRMALQDEIEAAKKNAANSSIPLNNGKRIGQQGHASQYVFQIDTVLNTPAGAPGDLIVPGKEPLIATIVSVEGLQIVISVETDLGEFVPAARLQSNIAVLMRKLIERIESNALIDNPAASRMLGRSPVLGNEKEPETPAPTLNEEQLHALKSALGRNLTVIWGPPGTGKTHTIGTITEHLYNAGRSVLIVSHTNTAVDQAIKHVAKALKEKLLQGAVLRIGQVKDDDLKSNFKEVLLEEQVNLQSQELCKQRNALEAQGWSLDDKLGQVQKKISIIEWIKTAQSQIQATTERMQEIRRFEGQLHMNQGKLSELTNIHSQLLLLHDNTSKILAIQNKITAQRNEQIRLRQEYTKTLGEIGAAKFQIQKQESRIKIAQAIAPLRQKLSTFPSLAEQKSIVGSLSEKIVESQRRLEYMQHRLKDAEALLNMVSTHTIKRFLQNLPKPETQKAVVGDLSMKVVVLATELQATQSAHENSRKKLVRILELDAELSQFNDIGTYADEIEKKRQAEIMLQRLEEKSQEYESTANQLDHQLLQLDMEISRYSENIHGDPKGIFLKVCSKLQQLRELQESVKSLESQICDLRKIFKTDAVYIVNQLKACEGLDENELIVGDPNRTDAFYDEIFFETVYKIYQRLAKQHKPSELPSLNEKSNALRSEIKQLKNEIEKIKEIIAQIERNVIMNASVIGATLTKTYLSDEIQARKFDTVILDEASMAPIPALWAAALLSKNNLIIVGDFQQLPPIVLSTSKVSKDWLGRDIFKASGLYHQWEKDNTPDHFIKLKEQRRMVKPIADNVANIFYVDLRSLPDFPKGKEEFDSWYKPILQKDKEVVLVDTGSLNAWVTSVVKGGNSSRLNFLSATVCVDLAEKILNPDRSRRKEGDARRILIVAPYRAHSKLVDILLHENKQLEEDEVKAGTVHSFQGSEADVIIFDLVVDEPHFRVNLFMPSLDEQIMQLFNVGLTRAKFRIFIVGDFSYFQKMGKKAFVGKILLPKLLKKFPRYEAMEIIPDGLAGRAAKAQMIMYGGEIEPNSERVVVTQADFFRLLSSDLSRTQNRIIIYSPFMTQDRLAFLMPQLQAAASRGVSIFIITKSHSERSKTEITQIRRMEKQLLDIGTFIIHKKGMHEKLVFIDDDITWSGSLNPLSFSNTQEVMERRKSKVILDHYFQTLRLQELLEIQGKAESKCPKCGSEMIAAEGKDQPYYWRCAKDKCFTRSIDKPYPFGGVLPCRKCNCSVEFGYKGVIPYWFCTGDKQHSQKVVKTHLHLPKMAELIPKGKRRGVCKLLGIKYEDVFDMQDIKSIGAVSQNFEQIDIFNR